MCPTTVWSMHILVVVKTKNAVRIASKALTDPIASTSAGRSF